MTRISFYVFQQADDDTAAFICKLAEKIHRLAQPIYILCADSPAVERLDRELWTFRQGSFLPHETWDGTNAQAAPILLGSDEPPPRPREVLINLSDQVPDFFSSFSRCVELVHGTDEQRKSARDRYRFYRDRGYELDSHKV